MVLVFLFLRGTAIQKILCICVCVSSVQLLNAIQKLHLLCNGHRTAYYYVLEHGVPTDIPQEKEDLYSLGLHLLYDHGCTNREDFNKAFNFHVLEHSSPSQIEKREHIWIHKLDTLHPSGINKSNPFGLPIWTPLQ